MTAARKYQAQVQDLFGVWYTTGQTTTDKQRLERIATLSLEAGFVSSFGGMNIKAVRITVVGSTAHKAGAY